MRIRDLLLPAALLTGLTACESTLAVDPTEAVPEEIAIIDANSARAAVRGMYDGLQNQSYYGEWIQTWGALSADDARRRGTFTSYREADNNLLKANNSQVEDSWEEIYEVINRANIVIATIPGLPGLVCEANGQCRNEVTGVAGLGDEEKNQMVGEAHFLRALAYHDLVKFWGRVPIRLTPIQSIDEAAEITRASLAENYAQIKADLDVAEALLPANSRETRRASVGAVRALRTRVLFYEASAGLTGRNTGPSGGWQAALDEANRVLAMGYQLAEEYADLFHASGADTPEDIFRVRFIAEDAFWAGYYFHTKPLGGRFEVGPTADIIDAFEAGDARRTWSLKDDASEQTYIAKFPTPIGAEHPHVIRLAEIILVQAEALAQLGRLPEAVNAYNRLRARAGLMPHVYGVDVIDGATVMAAIQHERRVELAFEGDRWPDLVRSDRVVDVMELAGGWEYQALYPIPQSEIDVTRRPDGTPRLEQNPDY